MRVNINICITIFSFYSFFCAGAWYCFVFIFLGLGLDFGLVWFGFGLFVFNFIWEKTFIYFGCLNCTFVLFSSRLIFTLSLHPAYKSSALSFHSSLNSSSFNCSLSSKQRKSVIRFTHRDDIIDSHNDVRRTNSKRRRSNLFITDFYCLLHVPSELIDSYALFYALFDLFICCNFRFNYCGATKTLVSDFYVCSHFVLCIRIGAVCVDSLLPSLACCGFTLTCVWSSILHIGVPCLYSTLKCLDLLCFGSLISSFICTLDFINLYNYFITLNLHSVCYFISRIHFDLVCNLFSFLHFSSTCIFIICDFTSASFRNLLTSLPYICITDFLTFDSYSFTVYRCISFPNLHLCSLSSISMSLGLISFTFELSTVPCTRYLFLAHSCVSLALCNYLSLLRLLSPIFIGIRL